MSAHVPVATRPSEQSRERGRRHRAQIVVSSWFDIVLSSLALVMVALLVVEFTADLGDEWSRRVTLAQLAIWLVFVAAFVVEFGLAASKTRYLRRNWITVIALVIPMFRILRVFSALRILRTARAARSLSILRASTTVNSAARSVAEFLRISQFGYAVLLTVLVTFVGAAGGYLLERGSSSGIDSYGDALWWSATIVTTVNSPLEAVTFEGRIVAIILRIFGVTVIGYITARLAVYFLGRESSEKKRSETELRAMHDEIVRLRELLERRS